MKKLILLLVIVATLLSCENNDNENVTIVTVAPATYSFERGGLTTVSFDGQTKRIQMANQLWRLN